MNRNTQIVINDDLLRKIVYCIEKAIGDDLQQYLRENHRETNNAIILLRGDNINTNLRTHVVKDDIDLVPFQRYGWSENPHYLQSVLYVENKDCIAKARQMTLEDFGITIFDTDVLEQDFEKISQGMINVEEDYKHYIIAYKAENGEIKDIKLRFLDKDFNIVDEASLMQYIKPDFARLTDIGPSEDTDEDAKPDKKGLVAIKSGIKPKLREIEKKA